MLLIYLPKPINSRNTIMRKGRLVVVILGSIFLKTLKVRSQVKDLLNTFILNSSSSSSSSKLYLGRVALSALG